MKTLKRALLILFIAATTIGFAQDINSAGESFNLGNEAYKTKDFAAAIKHYETSLGTCGTVGAEADGLKTQVNDQLTKAYYYNAQNLYKEKNFDEAVAEFQKTSKQAEITGDVKTKEKSDEFIPKVYSSQGLGMVSAKEYDKAIEVFNKALQSKGECVNAYFGLGLAYKEKDMIPESVENFKLALKNGENNAGAAKTVEKVKDAAQKMLEANAGKELQLEHAEKAIGYLNQAIEFGNSSANIYFMLTVASNKLKKYDEAIAAAQQGLTLGGDANNLNFELGKAYEGKGDKDNACKSYKAVTGGANLKAAQYQAKDVLKCN